MKTKRGGNMAIVTLDDRSGRVDARLFSDSYEKFRDKLIVDHLVVIEAEVKHDTYNDSLGCNINQVWNIQESRTVFAKGLKIKIDSSSIMRIDQMVHQLKDKLAPFNSNGASVTVEYRRQDAKASLQFGDEYNVEPTDELIYRLEHLLGENSVEYFYE